MRLSSIVITTAAFLVAAALSVVAARIAVQTVEDTSVRAVRLALTERGNDWAQVLGDGLQVIIEGTAPTESIRFRALSIAGGIVDASRVIDNMTVPDATDLTPPGFAIEILRGDSGVSLIGLIPAETDRAALAADITRRAGGAEVTDLLEQADYPMPEGWRRSVTYALRALALLPRAKLSIEPGRVTITAIADSADQKRRLESELARTLPEGVSLSLTINAPRPVITPFTLRMIIDDGGARLDACNADTPEAQSQIIAAATRAGVTRQIACPLALGVPSRDWGAATARAIEALAQLGGGTLTFSDTDATLIAAEGTDPALFDRIVGELSNALPDAFALDATLPVGADPAAEGPAEFSATLSPEGLVQLRGRVPDAVINSTVENFARARFGRDRVTMGTRIVADLPAGWSVRILAGVEALSRLSNGAVVVQPDLITVRGNTGNEAASADITRLLIEKLGQQAQFRIDVTYVEALDPIAGLPSPEECLTQITVVTRDRKITFDPGSATLSTETIPVVDDIAEILRRCADLRIEIAGYTDSQGRDEMNLRLSQQRADAVLAALRARRVPVASFAATGYGEADPIADNSTEAGREANRRIEFRLITPEPAVEEPAALDQIETGAAQATTE